MSSSNSSSESFTLRFKYGSIIVGGFSWLAMSVYMISNIVPESFMQGDVPLAIWPSMLLFSSGIYVFSK